ncbi:MAG TPA: AAA family ATPase [Stellaceae bacterium]|jgi:class 3 adenylate cyclase|nr:AAA family ATPase [Stellaceae bacterium]
MNTAAWLQSLGLERYEPLFRDNEIDWEVLPKLTSDDLREIGVVAIGHRRKLLDAIAALGAVVPAAETAAAVDVPAPADAERRQLTVLFCDLVGSTALSSRLDPEDLREVIAAYHRAVANIVAEFDGFVAKYMGDGVLVYFGYPRAHEDDAERAVRAGLGAIDAVGRLDVKSIKLQARVGIATGLAIVGDLIGEGSAQEQAVVGETPNLAARLQALAGPNMLVISEATRRQIGGLFDLEDLGPLRLAGFAEPQGAWRVLGESGEVSRFEALRSGETPLVGREEEVELLIRRWHQAKSGEGRVVLISGEPGIGKSRLTAALSEHIGSEPHTRLRYFCSPHHQDSALYPFIAQLEHAAGFVRGDAVGTKLGKLQTMLAPGTPRADDVALLAELLSLPSNAADLNLSPQRKREKMFEALLNQLEAEVGRQPVLMVFEDVHWIDPTSRELLDLTVDRVRQLPMLLAISFRPEFQPPWNGRSHVTSLVLNRLGERDGTALAQQLANAALSPEIVAQIVERTDGVPLFVEELTKAVLESVGQGDRVATVLATASPAALSVPATLHASLIARLDRLGPVPKEVAQIGAVIGREFAYELIELVAQRDERELQAALGQLSAAELLFCRGAAPHSSYLFKHALVQDAAYSTLLRGRRQELHAQAAAALDVHFSDLVEREPELLAHHLTAAGDTGRAIDQWLKAGRHAAARFAHMEAIRHFERGLEAVAVLPEGLIRDGCEIELQLARGPSLFTAKGFGAADAAEAYSRARELAEQRDDAHQLFMALNGLWQSANGAGRILECRKLSNRLQRLTANSADDDLRLQAHHSAWATCLFSGEPAAGRKHCEAGRRLYNPERHRLHHQVYGGHDPGMCGRYLGAQIHWLLGYPEKGLALGSEALALADQIAHPFSLAIALQYNSMLHLDRGEPELAMQRLDAAMALAAEQRLGLVLEPQLLRGAALTARGSLEEAVACVHEGLEGPNGSRRLRSYGLAKLADTLTRRGEQSAGLAAAREGLCTVEKTGHRQWEAELLRLEGVALFGLNMLEDSQNALEEALRVARKQHAKANELRAATSLARLWGEQGRRAEARDLLAPVYGWFTEGFDTADLKEAKALLDELA